MRGWLKLRDRTASRIDLVAIPTLATIARLLFASVLFSYYWTSGLNKLSDGLSNLILPSSNAFAQIFPQSAAIVSYDVTQATAFQTATILFGTWAELGLPLCIVLGFFTRAASVGMIIFILTQSAIDAIGHGVSLGAFFDATPDALIDQRALWLFLLSFLALRGGGPFALDRYFFKSATSLYPGAPQR